MQTNMGAWNLSPWDNDKAADWFGALFDELPLAAKVEKTLNLDVNLHHEEIRAAAALLIMLGRTNVWPIDKLDRHLELAIDRMEALRPIYQELGGDDWVRALDSELAVLKARLANDPNLATPAQPSSWGEFWGR